MSTLDQLKDNPGFTLPENYFEGLQDEVLAKIRLRKKQAVRKRIYLTAASIAAVALLIFSLTIFLPKNEKQEPQLFAQNNESQSSEDFISFNYDFNDEPTETPSSDAPSSFTEVIEETEWDNLDYQIMEFYSDDFSSSEFIDYYY